MILKYGDGGEAVRHLQQQLNDNDYRHPRRRLVVDGEFGALTATAVAGTKWWMGYPAEERQPIAGETFMAFLTDRAVLPGEYRERRKERLANIVRKSDADRLRARALTIIRGELGTLERPSNSNHIKYNEWWGWGPVPYCVIGISWAWCKAGSTSFEKGVRWANTDVMLSDAIAGRHGLSLADELKPGCPGVIDFAGHSDPDHAVTFVRDNGDGSVETIEFNTSKDSTYIQGVWRKDRPLRNCWFFDVEK